MVWSIEDNVPDMTGKTVIITGCTSGVGMHAARQLHARNATLVMACRNRDKMAAAAQHMENSVRGDYTPRIHQLLLDVADLESVRAFPAALTAVGITRVHTLVLNAGIATPGMETSPQGVELTFATNILGHWLLTGLLLPVLRAAAPEARIVSVSSQMHFCAWAVDYRLVRGESDAMGYYFGGSMYMQTKLAMLWFVANFNRRLQAAAANSPSPLRSGIVAVAAHPGYAESEITNPNSPKNSDWLSQRVLHALASPFRQPGDQGAWAITLAAAVSKPPPGEYYGPICLFGSFGPPADSSRRSLVVHDVNKQDEFWRQCEQLAAFTYEW